MREPVERVAPRSTQLADTLNNPLMTDLPRRMTETMDVLSSIPRALGPLGQVADLAGGFFGSRGLGAFGGTGRPSSSASRTSRGARRGRGRRRRGGRPAAGTTTMVEDRAQRAGHVPPLGRQAPGPEGAGAAKRTTAKKATKRTDREGHGQEGAGQEGAGEAVHGQEGRAPEDGGEAGGAQEGRLPIEPVSRRSLSPTGGATPRSPHARLAVHRVAGRVGEQALLAGAGRVHIGDGEAPLEQRGQRAVRPWHLDHEAGGARFEEVGDDGQHDGPRRRPRRRRSSPAPRWCRGGRGAAGCRRRPAPCPAARPSRSMASGRAPSARWYGTSPGSGQSYSSSGQLAGRRAPATGPPAPARRWPTGSRPASAVASRAGRTRRRRGGRRRPS